MKIVLKKAKTTKAATTATTGQRKPKPALGFDDAQDENNEETDETALNAWKSRGVAFAEAGDFVAALSEWKRYSQARPRDAHVLEMSSQAYLATDQVLLALQCAESAVSLTESEWAAGLHTLARCQREIGELYLSVETYERARALLDKEASCAAEERAEIEAELAEVRELADQLTERRRRYEEALQSASLSAEQHEVCRCKYHLAARAAAERESETQENENSNANNNGNSLKS